MPFTKELECMKNCNVLTLQLHIDINQMARTASIGRDPGEKQYRSQHGTAGAVSAVQGVNASLSQASEDDRQASAELQGRKSSDWRVQALPSNLEFPGNQEFPANPDGPITTIAEYQGSPG